MQILCVESAHWLGGCDGRSLEATTATEVSLGLLVLLERPQARVPEKTLRLYLLPESELFKLQSFLYRPQVQKRHSSVEAHRSAQAWAVSSVEEAAML